LALPTPSSQEPAVRPSDPEPAPPAPASTPFPPVPGAARPASAAVPPDPVPPDQAPPSQAPPDQAPPIPRAVWRLAAIIVFGAFMSGLDASVVNVGLHTIARDLDTDLATAQWAANGYLLALGVSLPVCGWLGRRVGVGRLWLAALAAFTASSALCAAAPTIEWLIALRVLQGLSAGVLIPAGQTILGQAVGPARLGRVMSVLGIAVTSAPAIGPVVLGLRHVPRGTPEDVGRLDRLGATLLTAGLPAVVYGVTAWGDGRSLVDPAAGIPLGLGLAALLAYGLHAGRVPRPLLDLDLFRNRTYAAATATATFTGAAFFGAALIYPLYFQVGRGAGPVETGLLLLPLAVGTIVVLPTAGRLVDHWGGGPVAVIGGIAMVATTLPFAVLDTDADGVLVQALLLVRGAATAFAFTPAAAAAYKTVSRAQLPDATTQVNIVQRLGGALGGALAVIVLASGLPDGPDAAFHATFALLTAMSAAGALAAGWLLREERRGAARTRAAQSS
jgi:MFS family permease